MVALALLGAALPADARLAPEPSSTAGTGAEDGDAELEALRRAEAELAAGPEGDAKREALLLEIGRAERRRYDATGDAAHLSAAQAALRGHLELASRRGTLTDAHRVDIEAELTALDNLSGWETSAPTDPAAATSDTAAPIVTPALPVPSPPPTPPDPSLARRLEVAEGLTITGATFLGLGGAAWLFLAVPALIAAEVATNRANDDPFLVSESELQTRAERRRRFARISFWSGLGGAAAGGILLGVGLGSRAKLTRESNMPRRATLHLHPTLGLQGAGATLVLRH